MLDELREHCRTRIAGYKIPRQLLLVDEVPRLPNGKPDYRSAKEQAKVARPRALSAPRSSTVNRSVPAQAAGPTTDRYVAMTPRRLHRIAALAALLVRRRAARAVGCDRDAPAAADTTTQTPVMGPSLLTAAQLAAWYHSAQQRSRRRSPRSTVIPANDVAGARAGLHRRRQGRGRARRHRVRAVEARDRLAVASPVRRSRPTRTTTRASTRSTGAPALPNCAHGDSAPSRCMGTPQHGVLVQIQLLRSYADPSAKTAPSRFISAPSDRAGARAAVGVLRRSQLPVRQADLGVGRRLRPAHHPDVLAGARRERHGRRVRAVRAAGRGPDVGHRLLGRHDAIRIVHPFGDAKFLGDTREHPPRRAAHRRRVDCRRGNGYWLLGRDGGIFSYGDAHFYGSTGGDASEQAGERHGAHDATAAATGSSPTTAASSRFGNAHFYGSMGGDAPQQAGARHGAHARAATATGSFASDGGIFSFGDAHFYGSLGGTQALVAGRRRCSAPRRARATG